MLIDSLGALCLDTFDPSPVASFLSISHSACPTPCINHGVVRLFFWIVPRLFWSWLALLYHKIFDISWHIWLIPSFMIFKSHYFRRPSNCTILHRQLTTTTFLNLFGSLRQTLRLELRGGLHLELLWVWQVVLLPEPRLRPRILTLASKTCSADQCSFVSCSMTMNDAWYAVQLRRTPLQSVLHHGFPLANVRVTTGCCCRCRCCRRLVHRFKLWHCHTDIDIGGFCFGLPGCLVRSCKHQFLMFLRCPGIGAAAGVAAVLNRAGSWNWWNHVKKCQAELQLSVSLQVQIVRQDQYGQWPPPPVALYSDLRSKSQQFQVALLDLSRCLSLWTDRPWHQIPSCAIRTWTLRPCNISPTCCGMISYWFMMIYDAYGYWYLLMLLMDLDAFLKSWVQAPVVPEPEPARAPSRFEDFLVPFTGWGDCTIQAVSEKGMSDMVPDMARSEMPYDSKWGSGNSTTCQSWHCDRNCRKSRRPRPGFGFMSIAIWCCMTRHMTLHDFAILFCYYILFLFVHFLSLSSFYHLQCPSEHRHYVEAPPLLWSTQSTH